MLKSIFCFIFVIISLFSQEKIKDKLSKLEKGDYLAMQQKEILILLFVRDKKDEIITFEEICAPKSKVKLPFQEWLNKNAPFNTSWIIYELDLKNEIINTCYSISQRSTIQLNELNNALLINLLKLPITYLDMNRRRRISTNNNSSHLWTPPFSFEGTSLNITPLLYITKWPNDNSFLSNKTLEIYFSEESSFPYWIQIENSSTILQSIELGKNLTSSFNQPAQGLL